jgi:hypothetical protein
MKFMQGFFYWFSKDSSIGNSMLKSLHIRSYLTSSKITHTDIQTIIIILHKYGTNKQTFLPLL